MHQPRTAVPLAVMLIAGSIAVLKERQRLTPERALLAAAACLYGVAVVDVTLLPDAQGTGAQDVP